MPDVRVDPPDEGDDVPDVGLGSGLSERLRGGAALTPDDGPVLLEDGLPLVLNDGPVLGDELTFEERDRAGPLPACVGLGWLAGAFHLS